VALRLIRMMTTTRAKTLAGARSILERNRTEKLLLPLLLVALSACAQPEARLTRSALAAEVSAGQALALPPPGGPSVIGVVERRFSNAIQHDIALATTSTVPGQNVLRVQMFSPSVENGGDTALADKQLHMADIRREIRTELAGVAMQQSPLYAQNSYGPFGYSLGRAGTTDLCLYAWQRIAGTRDAAPLSNVGTVQVRLRICSTGATESGLLAMMYGYTLNAAFAGSSWNPYGSPPAADARLGQTGQPIVPLAPPAGYEAMLDPAPLPPPTRPTRRVETVAPTAIPTPPPGAPLVPAPPAAAINAVPAPTIPLPPEQ
jgi:hypothetical protein